MNPYWSVTDCCGALKLPSPPTLNLGVNAWLYETPKTGPTPRNP